MIRKIFITSIILLTIGTGAYAKEEKKATSPALAASAALKSNLDPVKFETPLIAIPEEVKQYVSSLGAFVELQRLCKDTTENKQSLQKLLTRKEDSLQLVYGLAPLDYRTLLEKGADSQEEFMSKKNDKDKSEICGKFLEGIVNYINTSKKDDDKLRANIISLEKELGVKQKMEQKMKGLK